MGRVLLLSGLLFVLAGCASGERDYSGPETTRGGVSVNVFPDNYRAEIIAYQRSYLNDPTGIRSAAISQPALRKVGSVERYAACVRFNAKAAGGTYTGVRDYLVIFLAGKLDQMAVTREECNGAAYEPFPELERLTR
jgi:hypothetical protein